MARAKQPRRRPSASQLTALRNLVEGRSIDAHVYGRSQSGGFSGTIIAMHRRGWVGRDGEITDAGRAILHSFSGDM